MEIIKPAKTDWSAQLSCHKCECEFLADQDDLESDNFKKPGTYWFDGSARAAGLTKKFFVTCPNKCDIIFVDEETLPFLLKKR